MQRRTTPAAGPEYVLTDKGRDLAPALIALTQWGDRWAAPDGPPIRYTHEVCGGAAGMACTAAQAVRGATSPD